MGMTQEGLAQALSVTFSTVSRWENGHVVPSKLAWRALQQLAEARSCPLEVEPSNGST
jgi:putative transcriptional regulator